MEGDALFPIDRHRGTLRIWTDSARARSALLRLLGSYELRDHPADFRLSVRIRERELAELVALLSASLSDREMDECAGVFHRAEPVGSAADRETRPLRSLISEVQGHWLWELIENNRLTCHFQPIVSVQGDMEVVGYECLMRAKDMRNREVLPDRLLQAARDAKVLPILDTAAQLTAIHDATAYEIRQPIFINVSPLSVTDPLYDSRPVIAAARRSGFPAEHFVFEVTESDTLEDFGPFLTLANRFRRLGVRVALDDLGSGYASLNLLPTLKPDFIKLDMQMIQEVDRDPFKGSIVTKLVEMSKELGVPTIAEGVETGAQWEWIRAAGVHYAQGYYLARPAAPPPLLGDPAPSPLFEPSVRPLLELYLEEARHRLADLTACLVSRMGDRRESTRDALDALQGSLDVMDVVHEAPVKEIGRSGKEAVAVVDPAGAIRYHTSMNDHGYEEGELLNCDFFSLVHPADLPVLVRAFEQAIRNPSTPMRLAIRLRHDRGDWVDVDVRGYTTQGSGSVGGFVLWLSTTSSTEPNRPLSMSGL